MITLNFNVIMVEFVLTCCSAWYAEGDEKQPTDKATLTEDRHHAERRAAGHVTKYYLQVDPFPITESIVLLPFGTEQHEVLLFGSI